MSEFVKELNFDCDTFSGMKRDMTVSYTHLTLPTNSRV